MKKVVKNALIGAGIATASAGAVTAISYQLTRRLVGIAMDREEPEIVQRSKERISGSAEATAILERMDEAEERLRSSDCETVEILSDDGLKLIGHWKTCEDPKRVIVAMHGWRSSWAKDFGIISEFFGSNDCDVLFAEQRAQGNSEGEYMTFGLLERYDCLSWIRWVNERTGGTLPVYLGGISMGATTILMAAGLELPENVRGIIADCGFTSTHAIWKHVASNNIHVPYTGLRAMLAEQMSRQKTSLSTKEYSTVDAMRVCKVPVLLIHGADDHFVPVSMSYENFTACASEKRLLIVPGAEHGMSYLVDTPTYQRTLLEFWKEHD